MVHYRTYSGRIAYVHDTHGETGREWFTVTVAPDERTVRARCEMDDIALLRDVTYTVGADWAAKDCFNRVRVHGRFAGSGWFRFDGCDVELEALHADAGRIRQAARLGQPTPIFACHPLLVDGWHAAAHDPSTAGVQLIESATNSSMPLDGSAAPFLGIVRKGLECIGDEEVAVPAGRFAARRYRIHPMRVEAPHWTPLDFWVSGPELVLVKLRWDMIAMTYLLAELDAPEGIAVRLGAPPPAG